MVEPFTPLVRLLGSTMRLKCKLVDGMNSVSYLDGRKGLKALPSHRATAW
jgi:hypothetical protein